MSYDDPRRLVSAQVDNDIIRPVISDKVTHALVTLPYEHHEIHEGDSFFVHGSFDVTTSVTTFLVITPNTVTTSHLIFGFKAPAEYSVLLSENASVSSNGTALPSFNSNRNSVKTAGTLFFVGPTLVNTGTTLWQEKLGSGNTESGQFSHEDEILLKTNTKYFFTANKVAAGTQYLNYIFHWYEHTSKI